MKSRMKFEITQAAGMSLVTMKRGYQYFDTPSGSGEKRKTFKQAPGFIRHAIYKCPEHMRPAAANALFPRQYLR